MARTKRTAVQREPSSEYTSKADRPAQRGDDLAAPKSEDAALPAKADAPLPPIVPRDVGLTQLVISVAGIYGSLYVC